MSELMYKQSGDYLLPDLGLTVAEQQPLGKYSLLRQRYLEQNRPGGRQARMDAALEYLYGREYQGRGLRGDGKDGLGPGSLAASAPNLVSWLGEIRVLFPRLARCPS